MEDINFDFAEKFGVKKPKSPFRFNDLNDLQKISNEINKLDDIKLFKIISNLEFNQVYIIKPKGKIEFYENINSSDMKDNRIAYYYLSEKNLIFVCAVQQFKVAKRKKRVKISTLPQYEITAEEHYYKEQNPNNNDSKLDADNRFYKKLSSIDETEIFVDGLKKGVYEIHKYGIENGFIKTSLIRIPDTIEINLGKGEIIYHSFKDTNRRFINPHLLSGYIGVLFEMKRSKVISTGSCFKDGTCFPSTTHINGESIDISKKSSNSSTKLTKTEIDLILAFSLYHFKLLYTNETCKKQLQNIQTNMLVVVEEGHNDHFHFGNFAYDKIEKRQLVAKKNYS